MKTVFVPDFELDSRQPVNKSKIHKGFNNAFQLIRQFIDYDIIPNGNVAVCAVVSMLVRAVLNLEFRQDKYTVPSKF